MMSTPILWKEALGCRQRELLWSESQDSYPGILAPRPHSDPFLQPPHQKQKTCAPGPGQACLWKAEMDFAFFDLKSQLGAGHSVAADGMNNPELQRLAWNPVS